LDVIRSLKEENKILKSKLKKYEPDNDWLWVFLWFLSLSKGALSLIM
jgi:hypothetical protein